MDNLLVVTFILQGAVFLLWAILAFRWLFALLADAVALSGRAIPGPSSQLRAFRDGLRAPRYRGQRMALLVLTSMMLALGLLILALIG